MKHTNAITLAVLSVLTASGCTPQDEPTTYTPQDKPTTYASAADCAADGKTPAECQSAFDQASKLNAASAPKFNSAAECQAQFSNCTQSSGGWFVPAMMGYVLGNMMGSNSRAPAAPVYYDHYRRPQAASFVGGTYRLTPARPTYTPKVTAGKATTSARGGFGGRTGVSS